MAITETAVRAEMNSVAAYMKGMSIYGQRHVYRRKNKRVISKTDKQEEELLVRFIYFGKII